MSSTIAVPADLVAAMRDNMKVALPLDGFDSGDAVDKVLAACDEIQRLADVLRALSVEADAYPREAVRVAAIETIEDAGSRISDDHLTVDEAEFYIDRIRACEALLAGLDEPGMVAA